MDFRILGPLEVSDRGRPLGVGPPRQRTLLAALLVDANQVVPVDRLVDCLWQDTPPRTARNTLQAHVAGLRRALGQRGSGPLLTRPPGYLLAVPPGRLDAERFELLVRRARRALDQGTPEPAAQDLRHALALWRGPVLADVASEALRAATTRLEELRLLALEERIEADLRLGRHADVVAELRQLVAGQPLRERLWAQLMLALYRSGRQGDALLAYRQARDVLSDELGLEPGPALRGLQRAILAADPDLAWPPPGLVAAVPEPKPAELPPDIADFAGREPETAMLDATLVADPTSPGAVTVTITGKPGVGKSALAVHASHRLRARFPDGQLYADLGGSGPAAADPAGVLARFLHALGVPSPTIPSGLQTRELRYRTELADRRVLVVLEDAANEPQVRPLLPGGSGCATLVTSRTPLAGLEAVVRLPLDVLAPHEAIMLLGSVAGPERVTAEPRAARAIVRRCGRLPLAIRIAGAKLAARPHWRLGELAERLRDEHARLGELATGDLDVRASVALSDRACAPDERRAFRLLALADAPDLAGWLAAALLGVDRATAQGLLERLVDAQLLEVAGRDAAGQVRYRFHELLRVFARERMLADIPQPARDAALRRALDAAAAELRQPGDAWIEAERAVLLALVEHAHRRGWWEAVSACTLRLSGPLRAGMHLPTAQRVHERALDAARRVAKRNQEAAALSTLGEILTMRGRWDQARDRLEVAATILRRLGDREGEARAMQQLGALLWLQGHWDAAVDCIAGTLPALQESGDRHGEAKVLRDLGYTCQRRAAHDDAVGLLERSLEQFTRLGDRHQAALTHLYLGIVDHEQGRPEAAAGRLSTSLAGLRAHGDLQAQPHLLPELAVAHLRLGRVDEAITCLRVSLRMARRTGDPLAEAVARHHLGQAYAQQGRLDPAIAATDRSLRTFRDLGTPYWQARALYSIGTLLAATGRTTEGQQSLQSAMAIFQQLAAPEAERVQAQLEPPLTR